MAGFSVSSEQPSWRRDGKAREKTVSPLHFSGNNWWLLVKEELGMM